MTPAAYKSHRIALGLTQAALAARLGIKRETVNRREKGKQAIPEEAALAILALVGRGRDSTG